MTVLITILEQITLLIASQYQQLQEDIFVIYIGPISCNKPSK